MSDQKSPAVAGANQKMVTELKVSGHLMALDTGLFCIFTAPGSASPDPATGLPGVRVSLPSGPAFRPEAVTISTFRDDGWLTGGEGAALVRVTRGPAQLLVTIYQAPNSTGEAPRLQILRLNDGAPMPAAAAPQARPQPRPGVAQQGTQEAAPPAGRQPQLPAPQPPAPPAAPQNSPAGGQADPEATAQAEIVAHVQGRADVLTRLGEWMGEPSSKRWIEGFAIAPKTQIGANDIEYQAVLGRGWLSPWAEGGQYCGSRGMSLPILGLRVRLRGEAAERFDCAVTASFTDGTQIGPLDNGEPCQAESLAPLEAFRVQIVPRGEAPKQAPPREAPAPKPALKRTAPAKPPAKPPAKAKPQPPAAPAPAAKGKSAPAKPAPRKR